MDSLNLVSDSDSSKGSAVRLMDISEFHGPQSTPTFQILKMSLKTEISEYFKGNFW